ncbi:Modifying wall lignin-1/2 protein [Dioscorea alata]|uniref:Modifying wall lignin-1/2 protein n=1 Tax=Dioscorea alata TaxID=55571 RepID=A0ACB7UF54_DIOAL|nr:Modifying wall lignin-1/2 protein [Dioscorea alata]
MDKLEAAHGRRAVLLMVLFLGSVSFSCCIAAEFKKAKAKEMKLDGSLCALRQSPALGLGITALVCLSIAQMVGTSMAAARICPKHRKSGGLTAPGTTNHMLAIAFLLLSWVSFGLAAILLGAGSSMNARQRYGKGWLDGKCYVVKDGVYVGAGVLVLATTLSILALMHTTKMIIKSLPLHHLPTTPTLRDNNNKTTSTTPA